MTVKIMVGTITYNNTHGNRLHNEAQDIARVHDHSRMRDLKRKLESDHKMQRFIIGRLGSNHAWSQFRMIWRMMPASMRPNTIYKVERLMVEHARDISEANETRQTTNTNWNLSRHKAWVSEETKTATITKPTSPMGNIGDQREDKKRTSSKTTKMSGSTTATTSTATNTGRTNMRCMSRNTTKVPELSTQHSY